MSEYLIGEVVTRFYLGKCYRFKYAGQGEFKVLTKGVVPSEVRQELLNK